LRRRQLGKLKARMEKDKMTVKMQLDDTKSAIEHVSHERAGRGPFFTPIPKVVGSNLGGGNFF
jgi:hypothetical protein